LIWLDRSSWDPVDFELEPYRIEEKTEKEKTQCNPTDPATWSKIRLQPVDFCFLLKQRRFDLFKKELTWTIR